VFLYANSDTLTFEEILATLQIEKGNKATEYEEYGEYEYIDFGNYIVKEVEKQEDTRCYLIKCYDKMLYSMKDYESMSITYPISIRNYINAICTHLNLTFANTTDEFTNYNKEIPNELYLDGEGNSIGYTFRDVLDDLAEATASTIVINDNDELEIRYITDTEDTIDEEYLKDINVNFGESYGAVNTIVLSRSAGADKISISTREDMPDDEKIAIEIVDNQIMNSNDREEYITEILGSLAGLQYYLNDFSSTGICYYDICDRYTVQVDDKEYSCVMFNDEINITQGLEEIIYTEIPETSETEYKYTDKTDKRINKTTLIVDKQNQTIEGLITQQTETSELLSQTIQSVENIQNIFQITGGSNLIKNSQFLLTDAVWEFNDLSGGYHTPLGSGYDGSLVGQTTAIAKIQLKDTTINTTLDNINNLIKGQTYTINYSYKQDELTSTSIKLINNLDDSIVFEKNYNSEVEDITNDEFQFVADYNSYKLVIETTTTSGTDGYFYLYDLMLNSGDKKTWEPAPSEIYSTILKMSQLGLQVTSTGANTTTLLNADGLKIFAGSNVNGTPITSFNDEGMKTEKAQTTETHIGNYVMTTLTINSKEHHVEYFGGE
jgi:hypothetical protein